MKMMINFLKMKFKLLILHISLVDISLYEWN